VNKKNKPREFWIEFGGNPSDDKEVYKRYSARVPFKPTAFSDEVIHTIEYSAYKTLLEVVRMQREALEAAANNVTWHENAADKENHVLLTYGYHIAKCQQVLAESQKLLEQIGEE